VTENPDFTRVNRYLHIIKTPGVSFDIYPAIVGMRARELRFEKIDETHLSFTGNDITYELPLAWIDAINPGPPKPVIVLFNQRRLLTAGRYGGRIV